ncbi:MAG: ATP-dependent helicase [Treponema sp.]|jgi:DNA helicase-2/ATP-dependent DNA helicase PcrA|nr:ATP-dependent helicase [Treponema sp.]
MLDQINGDAEGRKADVLSQEESLPPYLQALNPEQQEAVFHRGTPLLILAGAGSGKTRVITTKIAYLIREQGMDPRSILAVTFTNKAAREMAERARLIDERAAYAMLRTFHSFGAWFLRRNGALLGLNTGFTIYDDDAMRSLLVTLMEGASLAEIKEAAQGIARAKDFFLFPDQPELSFINPRESFRRLYARYEERLHQIGNVDFGDLIKKPVEILRSHPEVASRFRNRFRVILVDEYQDANIAQFELLKELSGPETYVCVVGDDDQSIYGFRGAEVRNILEFPERFPGTRIIRLERNYRSTAPILQIASSVVSHNQGRLGKTLRAERGKGKKPVLAFLPNQDAEAAFCADIIEQSVHPRNTPKKAPLRQASYADWAVLYRTHAQSLGFETEFLRRGIPYRVVGSLKFYEREEVKDALALLSFLVNPRDEIAFRRVVNKPARGVGPVTVDRIVREALSVPEAGGNLHTAARNLMPALSGKARSGIERFLTAIEKGRALLERGSAGGLEGEALRPDQDREEGTVHAGEGLSVCMVYLVRETGILDYHRTHDTITGNQRVSNLQELANAGSLYAPSLRGLLEFLEHLELDRSLEDAGAPEGTQDRVTLITLHTTKGLEFPRVIITGMEQGVFPRNDKKGENLEEERRLFYVGATRAMDELYLSSCIQRRMYGRTSLMEPSLFLMELDRTCLRVIGAPPLGYAPRKPSRPPEAAHRAPGYWDVGDRLFHDDQGYGSVVEVQDTSEGALIRVCFDTGKEMRFLSLKQQKRITKIYEDR